MCIDCIIAFLISALYGFFKACTDIKRDKPISNFLWHYFNEHQKYLKWYVGGAESGYNQRFPWTSDFWHFCDDCKFYLLMIAFLYSLAIDLPLAFIFVIPMLYVAGRTFALFYHYLLPDEPNGGVYKFVVNSILFWKAENV